MAKNKKAKEQKSYHEIRPDFFNEEEKISVHLIGCGGNGSHILTRLALLNYALLKMDFLGLDVTVFDNDIVEENNVGRQMFTLSNIGENKAVCAVGKINMSFGYDWKAVSEKYNPERGSNILITAVDNVETRRFVKSRFYSQNYKKYHRHVNQKYMYWIDCGNGKDFGQVVVSDAKKELQNIFDISPNIKDDSENMELQGAGCSYADKLSEQGLFINTDMAQIVGSILEKMFMDRLLTFNVVYSNLRTMQRSSALKFAN